MKLQPVVIVQARMTSTRLPGKVLLPVRGRSLLEWQIERLRQCQEVSRIAIATTTNATDEPLVSLGEKLGLSVIRGSEHDVLSRYLLAAQVTHADPIIRITSDCPLIEPQLIDEVLRLYFKSGASYASNCPAGGRTYPRGLDTEVFSRAALEAAAAEAKATPEREHVTPFIISHPDRFKSVHLRSEIDQSSHRWTVDTSEDFELVRRILEHFLPHQPDFRWTDVLALLDRNPEWKSINAHIEQKKL